jgi:hypothetical protein
MDVYDHILRLRRADVVNTHLQRDFQAMVDRNNAGSAIGEELLWAGDHAGFDGWRMSIS